MSSDINGVSDSLLQHYKIEEQVLEQLLILENMFQEHNVLMKSQLKFQRELISRFWVLSQRYVMIESTGICCKFPQIYYFPAIEAVLLELHEKTKALKKSNCVLSVSIRNIKMTCNIFKNLCSQLDMTIESPFIVGDAQHKPLTFFIELVDDLFKYFYAWILKLKYTAHLMDPYKYEELENYKKLIEPSVDFDEYLNVGLTYCKCLKPKLACEIQNIYN